MEILKPGKLPPKPSEDYRGECQLCHAQVKCSPTDPEILPYSRTCPLFKVNCPTENCGGVIILNEYVTRSETTPGLRNLVERSR